MGRGRKKLLYQVREVIRIKHYSIRTEQQYISWIKRYILFHEKWGPKEMGAGEIDGQGIRGNPAGGYGRRSPWFC